MFRNVGRLFAVAAGMCLLLNVAPVGATQLSHNSTTVFPAEGNGVCKDYSANGIILQMGPSDPRTELFGTIFGPENPEDADNTGESAVWSYNPDTKEVRFEDATTPVDYAILKAGREVNVFVYKTGGVVKDSGMVLMDPFTNVALDPDRLVLCYGLADLDGDEPEAPIADCTGTSFDNVQAQCNNLADGTVVYIFPPGEDPQSCICNTGGNAVTQPCDPGGGGDPDLPACFDKSVGSLDKNPSIIEWYRDPFMCETTDGSRTCDCVDNPFTPTVNECAI